MTYTMYTPTTYDGDEALGTFTIVSQDRCTDVRARLKPPGRPSIDLGLVACLPGTDLADAVRFVSRKSRIGFLSRECLDTLTTGGR